MRTNPRKSFQITIPVFLRAGTKRIKKQVKAYPGFTMYGEDFVVHKSYGKNAKGWAVAHKGTGAKIIAGQPTIKEAIKTGKEVLGHYGKESTLYAIDATRLKVSRINPKRKNPEYGHIDKGTGTVITFYTKSGLYKGWEFFKREKLLDYISWVDSGNQIRFKGINVPLSELYKFRDEKKRKNPEIFPGGKYTVLLTLPKRKPSVLTAQEHQWWMTSQNPYKSSLLTKKTAISYARQIKNENPQYKVEVLTFNQMLKRFK